MNALYSVYEILNFLFKFLHYEGKKSFNLKAGTVRLLKIQPGLKVQLYKKY